jgi:two-component system sensor histidine kinase UhpB
VPPASGDLAKSVNALTNRARGRQGCIRHRRALEDEQGRDGPTPEWDLGPIRPDDHPLAAYAQHDLMRSARPLFRQVITVNIAVFVVAALLLALSPATVSSPLTVQQAAVLALGVLIAVGANVALVHRAFAPLARLGDVVERVDLLEPGERIDPALQPPEVSRLIQAVNDMLARLEDEQYASDRRASEAEEAERRRIARELHDELGQNLTALLVHLARAGRVVPESMREDLHAAYEAAKQNLDEVHRIVQQLRPQALDDLGLVSALASLVEATAARNGNVVRLHAKDAPIVMAADIELALYRIAQEALTNITRHAAASTVDVSFEFSGDIALLTIDDDGVGVRDQVSDRSGLQVMRERARLVGGHLSVVERPGGGARVRVEVSTASRRAGRP